MQVYEQVEEYMKTIGLKYIKNPQEFIAGLAMRTDKAYAQEMAAEFNSRAEGAPANNTKFYKLKNRSLEGSVYISAAFDSGVFRHIGNMIIDVKEQLTGEVLDLCCDCGIVTCFMAKYIPEAHFTGIDINESAIDNAKQLAEWFGLTNVDFICQDVYEMNLDKKFDAVTSFRSLLDAAEKKTKGLNFIGNRDEREESYKQAFIDFADSVERHLKDNGFFLSVERYTAEYGWLGWMQALAEKGIYADDRSGLMRAQDISSVKEYSVTYASKCVDRTEPLDVLNNSLAKQFKTGNGYDGSMAEFALYYDADGKIELYDVIKKNRVIHQFAFATSKKGKGMYYDASNDERKIRYFNKKKEESIRNEFKNKISLYDPDMYSIIEYNYN